MSNKILNTYAAYAFDDLIRKQSSSGAIFSLIAEKILSLSGIVYGVTMTDDCKGAEFVRVDNIEQLHLLRGSKYIQAKVGQSLFDTIQEKLCYKKVDYNAAIKYNPSEITSAPRPKERNKFFSDLEKKEFIKMEKKYAADAKIPLKQKVKNILRNALLRKNNGGGQ